MKDSLNMQHKTLERKLLYRAIYGNQKDSSIPAIYGSRYWVDNLDITHELFGHSGCVNALSWSRSGNLLASGSDDTHINIHTTNPNFAFNTSIDTGHKANIFSVKFMPFWNDRKIISAAGDWEVRIFDIEYAPTSAATAVAPRPRPSTPPTAMRFRRVRTRASLPQPAKLYSTAEANPKVYTSHHDRVKRIVTESSPYLFLTCSEDGEVRQFDLRQPSDFYQRSSGRAPSMRSLLGVEIVPPGPTDDHRNPPLISYKQYSIELNTISCSTGQPHYIALGGGHQHCFLHDRRMLGRDLNAEAGRTGGIGYSAPTRCVRKFAPPVERDNGHITACKISDAYPDELVVSWSADNVYLFDINRSPTADELKSKRKGPKAREGTGEGRVKQHKDRKGKEKATSLPRKHSSARKRKREEAVIGNTREGTAEAPDEDNASGEQKGDDKTVRIGFPDVRKQNLDASNPAPVASGEGMMKIMDDLRRELFDLQSSKTAPEGEGEDQKLKRSWTAALVLAKVCMERMDAIIGEPEGHDSESPKDSNELLEEDKFLEVAIRHNRARVRRFVQAAGTIARCLGGEFQALGNTNTMLQQFAEIQGEVWAQNPDEYLGFRYSFIKLIIAFLDGGKLLLEEIANKGFNGGMANPLEELFMDLLHKAEELKDLRPIINPDESDKTIFDNEIAALHMFVKVVKEDKGKSPSMKKFWGGKIARALLLREVEVIDFEFIDSVFKKEGPEPKTTRGRQIMEEVVTRESSTSRRRRRRLEEEGEEEEYMDLEAYLLSVHREGLRLAASNQDEEVGKGEEDEGEEEEEEHEEEETDSDDLNAGDEGDDREEREDEQEGHAFTIRRLKPPVIEPQVPEWNHIRSYSGHCNIKTVKDVNFFGLNDEYVVSGSDCGHVFIWDKKTSKLVQLLHGDDDTVNVITGHPYLPQLAVSGIDNTIKIFSPDQISQQEFFSRGRVGPCNDAEEIMDVAGDMMGASPGCRPRSTTPPISPTGPQSGGNKSRRRLHQEYRIRSQNEIMKETGIQEAIVTRSLLESLASRFRESEEVEGLEGLRTVEGCVVS